MSADRTLRVPAAGPAPNLDSALDAGSGVSVMFTDSAAGNLGLHVGQDGPGVQKSRRALEAALGVPDREMMFLNQVHGTVVARAEDCAPVPETATPEDELAAAPTADAAVTASGRALAVMVADCLPVVLTTESAELHGVAHAGRRGLLDGILPRAVEALRDLGASEVTAWIGPAVCGACYEVPEAMAAESEELLPGIRTRTSWGTPALDLPGAAARQLVGLGVRVRTDAHRCTVEDQTLFSHRRAAGEGRIAGIVWNHPPASDSGAVTPERTRSARGGAPTAETQEES